MPIMFNSILIDSGINLQDVRLIRHKDNRALKGRSPYELWRDNRAQFELYQSIQRIESRKKLNAPYWAVFVVDYQDRTMFIGLYAVKYSGLLDKDTPQSHTDGVDKAGTCDKYFLELTDKLSDFKSKLFIDWGNAAIAWIQYAERNNKEIKELHQIYKEPDFPGYLNFVKRLSQLDKLPLDWITLLKNSQGIYVLTCPKTKELYVGSASSKEGGFWRRWQDYVKNGHGGNIQLMSRENSDYQVSILEVAGSATTESEIIKMENRWKDKLQSKEMGLNSN